jgi:hypothetical protein
MTRATFLAASFLGLALTSACGDSDATGGSGGGGSPPISDATELVCPSPGLLPFVTETHAFADPDNQLTADGSDRNKDEASDALGVPSGVSANTYVALGAASGTGDVVYTGKKARTGQAAGLSSIPLRGEAVSLWYYDEGAAKWETLGRTTTDEEGMYSITPAGAVVTSGRPVYSILEADGTCAEHFDFLYPAGTKVVVSDIDGTLTLNDDEFLQQINDGTYVPKQMGAAAELANAWADRGYVFVYVTARPHTFRSESRIWLEEQGFPPGPMLTATSLVVDDTARDYKASWLNRIRTDFQWDVVAAYGNAQSDIDAYALAGLPKETTFIVGPLAGGDMTQPIANEDYSEHVMTYVDLQPMAN